MKKAIIVLATLTFALMGSYSSRLVHASSNLARGRAVTTSSTHPSSSPSNAVDGDPTTAWNAGHHPPAWIEIDLGASFSIDQVRLLVEQTPNGPTVHNVYFGDANRTFTLVEVLSRRTSDSEILSFAPNTARQSVRFVRIETTASPSWVAWNEIEVWGNEQ